MRARRMLAAMLLAGGFAAIAPADESPDAIAQLIARLGSSRFAEREAAHRALDSMGEPAIEPLRTAAKSGDAEVRRRATQILERVEQRASNSRLLKPTVVELDFTDLPLSDAIAKLREKTGLDIQLSDQVKPRRVTAVAKPMPVWDAIEYFCKRADLREWDGYTPTPPGFPPPPSEPQRFGGPGQVIILNRGRSGPRPPVGTDGRVMLHDNPAPTSLSHLAGAVRVRLMPTGTPFPSTQAGRRDIVYPLHVSPEASLPGLAVLSAVIEKAVDDQGQVLAVSDLKPDTNPDDMELVQMPNGQLTMKPARPRGTQIALVVRQGVQQAQKIAEIRGHLVAEATISDRVVVLDAPIAAGQPIPARHGITGKVLEAKKTDEGYRYSLEVSAPPTVSLTTGRGGPPPQPANGVFVLRGQANITEQVDQATAPPGTTRFASVSLEDANGKLMEVVGGSWKRIAPTPTGGNYQIIVTFRASGAEPAKLFLTGTRPASLQIPYEFRGVPLP